MVRVCRSIFAAGASAGLAAGLASCGPAIVADFNSAEPAARNSAIVKAAAEEDRSKISDLVRMLDSDDPATRLLAIQALERMTGERLGYDPAAGPDQREPAVVRWVEWVRAHPPHPVPPGENPPG
ncbi:hypothetical protein PHYC_01932 [Phycisphaerales bacterium]|nr:hypothetical protein PHYC_01932 [Phycisphaerales bacterium]